MEKAGFQWEVSEMKNSFAGFLWRGNGITYFFIETDGMCLFFLMKENGTSGQVLS